MKFLTPFIIAVICLSFTSFPYTHAKLGFFESALNFVNEKLIYRAVNAFAPRLRGKIHDKLVVQFNETKHNTSQQFNMIWNQTIMQSPSWISSYFVPKEEKIK